MDRRRQVAWVVVAVAIAAAWPLRRSRAGSPEGAERGDLTVEVSKLENSEGHVRAGVFTSNDGFPLQVDDVDTQVETEVTDRSATVTFEDLSHGTYAVVVYHDANANGELDRNFLGMPKEGAAVYKPVKSRFPPPSFSDCEFEFDADRRTVGLEMNYL